MQPIDAPGPGVTEPVQEPAAPPRPPACFVTHGLQFPANASRQQHCWQLTDGASWLQPNKVHAPSAQACSSEWHAQGPGMHLVPEEAAAYLQNPRARNQPLDCTLQTLQYLIDQAGHARLRTTYALKGHPCRSQPPTSGGTWDIAPACTPAQKARTTMLGNLHIIKLYTLHAYAEWLPCKNACARQEALTAGEKMREATRYLGKTRSQQLRGSCKQIPCHKETLIWKRQSSDACCRFQPQQPTAVRGTGGLQRHAGLS